MTTIDVQAAGAEHFEVVVRDHNGETHHSVTMSAKTYARLVRGGDASPVAVVFAVFEFLLDREPKESILGSFDVTVVRRYFPEFESALGRYLRRG